MGFCIPPPPPPPTMEDAARSVAQRAAKNEAVRELMEDWLGYPPGSGIMATPLDDPPVKLNVLTGMAHPYVNRHLGSPGKCVGGKR